MRSIWLKVLSYLGWALEAFAYCLWVVVYTAVFLASGAFAELLVLRAWYRHGLLDVILALILTVPAILVCVVMTYAIFTAWLAGYMVVSLPPWGKPSPVRPE